TGKTSKIFKSSESIVYPLRGLKLPCFQASAITLLFSSVRMLWITSAFAPNNQTLSSIFCLALMAFATLAWQMSDTYAGSLLTELGTTVDANRALTYFAVAA